MHYASIDGVITPTEQALIPVSDEGFLRGDGAFEVMRVYAGAAFALEDHYERLGHSCAGLQLSVDLDAFRTEVAALLEKIGPVDRLLRLVATRGGRRIAIDEPLPEMPESIRVKTVVCSPSELLAGLKTLSYAGNMLAMRQAKAEGFDEALFVTPDQTVLEGPTWSIFWVKDGRLFTPSLSDHPILPSITRARIMGEMDVVESSCSVEELDRAEEAFLASSVREVLPISAINSSVFPSAPGPVTAEAMAVLRGRIERELALDGATV